MPQLYEPLIVGKYCEKRNPYLARIAYAKGFGPGTVSKPRRTQNYAERKSPIFVTGLLFFQREGTPSQ